MNTPVAVAIFNRPDHFEHVFERIAQVKPKQLFVISDGPRADRPGEAEKCEATRAIIDRVDWDCRVERNYAEQNMGCGRRLSSGFDWLFSQVDRAIIIEDDCVPDLSFFPFCEELLDRYQDDDRVMHITGRSVIDAPQDREYSYYFTRQLDCWGWATWARAWRHYDFNISLWPTVKDERWLKGILDDPRAVRFFSETFDTIHGDIANWRTWAQQWNFAVFAQHGLGIRPYQNMVEYIGFDDATHEYMWGSRNNADLSVGPITFPLKHPPCLLLDKQADLRNYNRLFSGLERKRRIRKLKKPLSAAKRLLRSAPRNGR